MPWQVAVLERHPTTELTQDPVGVPTTGICGFPGFPSRYYTDALSNPVTHSEDQWPVSSALSACSRKSPKSGGYYCGCYSEAPIAGCSWCCPVSFFPHHRHGKDESNLGLKSKYMQGRYRKGSLLHVLEDHTPSVLHLEL